MNLTAFRILFDTRFFLTLLLMAFASPTVEISSALAQVTTAITPTTGGGNLGTTIAVDDQLVQITGGTRPDNGTNLFHSFDQFSVGRSGTAQFLNTTPSLQTDNIMGRVTGGNPSSIFGTIDTSSYPGANLFLMNPAGIVFGPSATLNVRGSVAITTADYLRLAEANGSGPGIFHTDTSARSLLTSASVAAFGFLNPNPAAIEIQNSKLTVQPGQSLALVGGNIAVQSGALGNSANPPSSAPGKQILIASVASPGEVLVGTLNQAPNIRGQSFGEFGTVRVSQNSKIDASGDGGGTILIRGGRLLVDDSTISANSTKATKSGAGQRLAPSWLGIGVEVEVAQDARIDNGSVIETNVESEANHGSGGVRITADHITISGGPKIIKFINDNPDADTLPFAGIRSNLELKSTAARSGDISLNADTIQMKEFGQIETRAASVGEAGHITLNASGNIELGPFALVSSLAAGPSGKTGSVSVSSSQGNVGITRGRVTTQTINSSGSTGDINLDASHGDIRLDSARVFTSSQGNGVMGGIQITADNLFLLNEASISGNNFTTQVAGNISIEIKDRLDIRGDSRIETATPGSTNAADLIIKSHEIEIAEGSRLVTSTVSSGDAGRLSLFTDSLKLTTGGRLSSRSSIVPGSESLPSGRGGVISIEGYNNLDTSMTIDGAGSGIFTSTEGTGPAGNIEAKAMSVTLQNDGVISAETTGISSTATGGSITIKATDQVTLQNGASITASSTGPADAGSIFINAGQQLDLTNGASITTTTQSRQANGGNIDIRAIDRVRLVDSTISTSVKGAEGSGGNIFIDPKVVMLEGSNVTAQAVGGAGGNITFVTPLFLADSASLISASSQRGVSGTVTIQSPTSNLSGAVGQLASKISPPQVLLQNRCVALAGGEQSTFLLAGRDTLPTEPDGWLNSPVSMEHLTGESTEQASSLKVRSKSLNRLSAMTEKKDSTNILSLRQLTPPEFLVRTFATGSTGCPS